MHCEDQGVSARIVVEHRFGRRVRQDTAVPIQLAVDPDGGERRRQRAGRHDVFDAEDAVAAVEISHLAGADMGGTDRQPRPATVHQIEIDELGQGLLQRLGGIVPGALGTERIVVAGVGQRIGSEEPRDPVRHGRPVEQLFVEAWKRARKAPDRTLLHPFPELLQAGQTVFRRIARDQAGIDGADRGADDPVRLDAGFVQRLVDAGLIRRRARRRPAAPVRSGRAEVLPSALRFCGDRCVMRVLHVSLPVGNVCLSARSSRRRPAARRR